MTVNQRHGTETFNHHKEVTHNKYIPKSYYKNLYVCLVSK